MIMRLLSTLPDAFAPLQDKVCEILGKISHSKEYKRLEDFRCVWAVV